MLYSIDAGGSIAIPIEIQRIGLVGVGQRPSQEDGSTPKKKNTATMSPAVGFVLIVLSITLSEK